MISLLSSDSVRGEFHPRTGHDRSNLRADDLLLLKEIPWKSFRRAPAITSPPLPLHTSLAACNNGTLEDFNAEIE